MCATRLHCAALALLVLSGCKADAEVESVTKEYRHLAAELVATVEASDDPRAGVREAQAVLDAREYELEEKLEHMFDLSDWQLSEEADDWRYDRIPQVHDMLVGLETEYQEERLADAELDAELEALIVNFLAISDPMWLIAWEHEHVSGAASFDE